MNEEKNLAEVTAFDKVNFVERVRIRRTLLQMTQEELAEKLEVSGETVKNIEKIESENSKMKKTILLFFNCSFFVLYLKLHQEFRDCLLFRHYMTYRRL